MRHAPGAVASVAAITLVASLGGVWLVRRGRTVGPTTRAYYLAADEVVWDYAPGGANRVARYREYLDASFRTLRPRPPEWEHLGSLGPVLRAAAGDTIVVVFRNHTRLPVGVYPYGLHGDTPGEAPDPGPPGQDPDDGVPPGGTYTYVWPVPERAGPAADGPASRPWMYGGHAGAPADRNPGLVGPIIVTRRAAARADGTPRDTDREFVVSFHDAHGHSVNGYVDRHLPGLTMRAGERVRWYLMGPSDVETHAPHWHGNTVVVDHVPTDATTLTPKRVLVADMVPDHPGAWPFHCHVATHLAAGMEARYRVLPAGES